MGETTSLNIHKSRNVSLDLLKLLAAYFVVLAHFPFPGTFGITLDASGRFAVPLFFMVSGYYSYKSSPEKILGKLRHILKLYLIAAGIYLVYKFVSEAFIKGTIMDGIAYLQGYLDPKTLVKLLLFNVPYSSGHLWFMLALTYCYGLLYFARKYKVSEKVLFGVAVALLGISLLLGEGLSIFGKHLSPILTRNFLFLGFPFFLLGLLVYKNQKTLTLCPSGILIGLALLGLAEAACSFLFLGKNELYLGSVLTSVSLLLLGLQGRGRSYPPVLVLVSEVGTPLYLWHCLIGESFVLPGIKEAVEQIPCWDILSPVVVCVLATVLAILIHKLTHKGEVS